jgi:putative transcriptional regulator
VVFVGGPVSQGAVIALARVARDCECEAWSRVLPRIGVLNLDADAAAAGLDVEEVRIFTGYAGWAPGQVEGEIEEGAWFVVDADPGDALAAEPGALWRIVLRRQPGAVAKFALYPADPTVN